PSGCGKSTLVRLLSKSMPFELIEWKYPSTDYDLDNYVNIMNQFQHFLNLSIRRDTMQQYQKKSKMKVIFVDDIPDITTPQVKRDFHSILSNCLNTPIRFLLVLVISGAWMESSHKRTYDTKLNNLIDITPQEFEYDKRVKHIKLKPVNKTCMTKALNRVIHGQDIYMSKDQLNDLIETSDGDLRSAINNLQFYAKRNQHYTKRRKTFDQKIGPLDLFHAVGKVLYAKRHADHTLQSKPEHILNKLPMDPDLFSTYLHQNCLVFFEDIDSVAKSFDYLSLADTIRSSLDWQDGQASLYRSLVTMHGLMERPTRTTSNRFYAMQKPDMFDAQLAMRQKKSQDYYREWMASVELKTNLMTCMVMDLIWLY
ncbi:Cell cycle checkpoint protein rad17, partial [Rhizopus stolonifer]